MSVERPADAQLRLTPVDFDPFARERERVALPLTAPQQEVWTAAQMGAAASAAYNQCFPLRLTGRLSVESLRAAAAQLVARHEALRVTFSPGGDQQTVAREGRIPIAEVDLSPLAPEAREHAFADLLVREASVPFDLAYGPLARMHVVREADDRHVLVLTAHHLVCDGWSSGLMFSDLAALYNADRLGLPARLPEAMSYGDYVRQAVKDGEDAASADYWMRTFAGDVPVLELPTDSPRPSIRAFRGSHERTTFDASFYRDIKALGARHGCTLYVTLLAAWQALLMRLAGQQDLVVGIPVSGQSTLSNGNLVGHCVHLLPLRLSIDPSAAFARHLGAARTSLVEGHEHRGITCGQLIERLNLPRHAGHVPLAAAVFNVDKLSDLPAFDGLAAERLVPPRSGYNFDIGLDIADTGTELHVECNYDVDLFDAATIRRWLGYYRNLLAAAAADSSTALERLAIMPPAEIAALREAGKASAAYEERCLHEAFEAVASETPDVVAVTMGDESATYDALNRRANQLARHLQSLGVSRGTLVGVCLDRSIDLIATLIGVLKAGGAYVPLDPDYPTDRINALIDDARPAVVIASERSLGHFKASAARVVGLERDGGAIAAHASGNLPGVASPGDLAYVIFTSGSTGRPKGVTVTHGNVSRLFSATDRWFHFGPDDVWTLFHSFAFDFSVWEIWGALLYGGRLVVVPHGVSRSPDTFHALLEREGVTVLNQTPSAFRQLIEADRLAGVRLSALRFVIFGGEALELAALRSWVDRYGDAQPALVNMYGITETTVHVTYRHVVEADVRAGSRSPIGVQIPDLELYLLAPGSLELVPVGVAGEICVGGAGVAPGYLNRPELTEARFVPDPFNGGGRLYRSGDLARRRADGGLEYLGRIDHQVKIRGFRVELGEVEAALRVLPEVRDCAVLAQRGEEGDSRLIAYVVAAADQAATSDAIRARLRARLPDYMVPSALVFVDALPMTAHGKLDTRALLASSVAPAVSAPRVLPRTPLEAAIAAQWQELLAVPDIGVDDSFFELGGHSLLVMQALTRLHDTLGVRLPVRALFEAPTVAAVAAAVRTAGGGRVEQAAALCLEVAAMPDAAVTAAAEARGIVAEAGTARRRAVLKAQLAEAGWAAGGTVTRRPAGAPLTLSFGQQRLWFLDQFEPGNCFYNITSAVVLRGPLDRRSLQLALGAIVERHEVLRTTFDTVDGRPVQVIGAAPAEWPLPVADLSALEPEARASAVQRLLAESAHRPFDLRRGPLLRSSLLRLDAWEHVLVLDVHHIAYDGWSHGVFVRELARLYEAGLRGEPAATALPPLPLQYADYACWQRAHLDGAALAPAMAYWKKQLQGSAPLLALPTDRPRPPHQTWHGALYRFHLDRPLVDAIGSLARQEGATLFMALMAAFQAFLHRYTAQDDVVVGTPVAGRMQAETDPLIGFFVNTLAIRTDLSGAPSFRELTGRVRRVVLDALAHQDLPFEKLVEELQVERSLSHSPVFQAQFALDSGGETLSLAGLASTPIDVETVVAKCDLTWWANERPDGLACSFEYNTDLFDRATAERFVTHFQHLLQAAVATPDTAVGRLPMLTAAEVAALGAGPAVESAAGCVHEWFAAQAARTPDAVAVSCAGATVSYAQLEARANQLAHQLQALGVGPESLVGVALERSVDLVVALLGVLKAGGAYVPMDPTYPSERLAYLLDDAQVTALVSSAAVLERLPGAHAAPVVCVDRDAAALAARPVTPPMAAVTPSHRAYVIYTSGSTGQPKGTEVTHANVTRLFTATAGWFGFGPADVWTLFHSEAFDFSVWELWGALLHGGRLVVVPYWVARAPDAMHELLRREGVTVLNQTPSAFRALSAADQTAGASLPALRLVIFGGEALEVQSLGPWMARHGDAKPQLVNMYGITETTVHVTYRRITREDVAREAGSVIGVPIPDLAVQVRSACGELVPVGVTGEIYVGGAGVARGYLRRPALTAERFGPLPGSPDRWYRSGDLARWLPTGELEYLGRADDQVKVRGFRIELGEVEAALRALPSVRDCAVVARTDGAVGKRLVAYLVPSNGHVPSADQLRGTLKVTLPDYMVPAHFAVLDRIPLTAHGKVDRQALPAADDSLLASSVERVAPRTPMEAIVAGIWSRALGRDSLSVHDNFFDLGGHSLLAAEVMAGIKKAVDVEVPLVALFRAPTVSELARTVDALLAVSSAAAVPTPDVHREEFDL